MNSDNVFACGGEEMVGLKGVGGRGCEGVRGC